MNRRTFLRNAGVVSISMSVAGCGGDSADSPEGSTDPGETEAPVTTEQPATDTPQSSARPDGTRWYDNDTEIGVLEGVETELDSIDNLYIRGTVQNFASSDYDYVQLSFAVYDSTEAKVADGLANTSGLAAGQRWRFEALAPGAENASTYALTDVTAY